jgi:hypothetical protein
MQMLVRRLFALSLSLAALSLTSAGWAQPADGGGPPNGSPEGPPQGPPHGPPPEALAACKALTAGQSCSFSSPRGSESGSCWAPPGKALACKPAHAGPPRGAASQPPPR